MADTLDLKSMAEKREGSNPSSGTIRGLVQRLERVTYNRLTMVQLHHPLPFYFYSNASVTQSVE